MSDFMQLCIDGAATPQQIDEYIERWRKEGCRETLRKFLGMSFSEYDAWVMNPTAIKEIVEKRKENAKQSAT